MPLARIRRLHLLVSLIGLTVTLSACEDTDPSAPAADGATADAQRPTDMTGDGLPSVDAGSDGLARSCSGPGEDPDRSASCSTDTFDHGGRKRAAIVCRPEPLPEGPLPLVLAFHGGGGNATLWKDRLPWHETGARHGFITVFMQGCKDSLSDCSSVQGSFLWNVDKPGDPRTVDDQAYTLAVLDRLEQVHGLTIDPGCRFATGHSLGGIFSYSLLCDQPTLLNAIGPVSAPPSDGTCTPHGGTSIFHAHGSQDANVPFDSGCCSLAQKTPGNPKYLPGCTSLPRCFNPTNWWPPVRTGKHPYADVTGLDALAVEGLGCDGSWEVVLQTDTTTCNAFVGCPEGREAEVCLVDGVDHSLASLDEAFDLREYLWPRFAGQTPR